MGRAPCCDKANVKKGPWSPDEDAKLKQYIDKNGTGGNWIALPQKVGLRRCGKSCRLRWLNYLRPNIKHGEFSDEEDRIICSLYATIGSRWSVIAGQLAGRTDNDIKNYWNTKLKKKLLAASMPPSTLYPNTFLQNQPINYSLYSYHHPTSNFMANPAIFNNPIQSSFMFGGGGGGEPSCSSSDGSLSDQNLWYFTNPTPTFDENQRLVMQQQQQQQQVTSDAYSSSSNYGYNFGDDQDYYSSIQEIKDLITSNTTTNNLSFIMDHDIKTEEN